jgi:hypothetical protein
MKEDAVTNVSDWYSAKLRILVQVEGTGTTQAAESVHVFRSSGWDAAMKRALELGQTHEREYRNVDGVRVCWRFHSVVTLDVIDASDLDGAEVHAVFSDLTDELSMPFGATMTPEKSQPGQSI